MNEALESIAVIGVARNDGSNSYRRFHKLGLNVKLLS
jgi:hypothetical protein